MSDLVLVSIQRAVCTLTLNQPSNINALSEAMLETLSKRLKDIAEDRTIKVVILRSAGEHFCAGHNLKEMTARRADTHGGLQYFQDLFAQCSAMMLQIVCLPQPVIAEVSGIATAAGCQLVASCDLAVAGEEARFATSGVNICLFCSTPMVALSRTIGRKHAMEMLLTGAFLSAPQALEWGLINRVVPRVELEITTEGLAKTIAAKSGAALKIGKRAFYEQLEMPLKEAYTFAGRTMAENMMARDTEAGIKAFISKQPLPAWEDT